MAQKDPILIKVANGREIALKPLMIIGRHSDCDLLLTEGRPSRRHATLTLADSGVWVEDQGSANGTFINGVRIAARTQLSSGDRLRFDVEEFDFRAASAPVDDANKTMLRSIDAAPINALSSDVLKRPGAWADPDAELSEGNRTRLIEPAQLKQMLAKPAAPAAAKENLKEPHLHIGSGSRNGLDIRLAVGQSGLREWSVGSAPEREVKLPDSGVSALHAKIFNEGARWKVVDQMSANGTFVNGKRSNVSYLSTGDRVRFGPVECIFHAAKTASSAGPVSSETKKNKTLIIAAGAFVGTLALLFILFKFVL